MGIRITLEGVDELPLSLFTMIIGVPDKNKEKLGPLSAIEIKSTESYLNQQENMVIRAQDSL